MLPLQLHGHNRLCRAVLTLVVLVLTSTAAANNWTMRVDVSGRRLEGTPLSWSENNIYLLSRDGRLIEFASSKASNYQKVSSSFRSYSQSDIRRQLLEEFGGRFEVSGTGQFLVVHPAGQRDLWVRRFEQLYRSFVHYFSARGLKPQQPPFPLIAIVFQRQSDFLKYAASSGVSIGPGVLGYYSPTSNRILLFDRTAGRGDSADWQVNASTIIHEAAHQSAFNTGIHNRFAPQPRWVVEGLGTMFEARGVSDSLRYSQLSDRINQGQLDSFKRNLARRRGSESMSKLVSSDRSFQKNPAAAYGESWALTFYLAETQPRKYFNYLAKTAARPPFKEYRAPERLKDFTSVFGEDFAMLDARLVRFIQGLK